MQFPVGTTLVYTSDVPRKRVIIITAEPRPDLYYTNELASDGSLYHGGTYDGWYLRDHCEIHECYETFDEFKNLYPELFI